ncbi:unnamed protein product [Pleuronectes platessa]|uniref:Uncharacterized protein n=1 Tax=Pleuronectes platessa TaxID=8262 RepID=A0A9N7VKP1_PLEPL|nr:unnamed protein product [Pleuronectes platessa]
MDRHQTGQRDQLVEVKTGGLEVLHQPGTSSANRHACFKGRVTLAIVMGLVLVSLVAVVLLQYFILRPSCNQAAPPLSQAPVTCPLTKRDGQGTYDIFTANKAGNYLIYGWVKPQSITDDKIVLMQKEPIDEGGKQRGINEQSGNKTEIFFFNTVRLGKNWRIILKFMFDYTDSLFHVVNCDQAEIRWCQYVK